MNFDIYPSLIGDCILSEPAMTALAIRKNMSVGLYIEEHLRPLYYEHPYITLLDQKPTNAIKINCSKALSYAFSHNCYFGEAYFEQVGLIRKSEDRIYYKNYHSTLLEKTEQKNTIVIAPFSRSCSIHNSAKANKTAPLEWWEPILHRCNRAKLDIICLGAIDEPLFPYCTNIRGENLLKVAKTIKDSRIFISVDTGLLHIASNLAKNIVLLNAALPPVIISPKANMVNYKDLSVYEISSYPGPPNWDIETLLDIIAENVSY